MTFTCPSDTGPGECKNDAPHEMPRGCVHWASSGSWVDDEHADGGHG